MTEKYTELCRALHYHVIDSEPIRVVRAGIVVLRDDKGSVMPLSSFELKDNASIFPAYERSEQELELMQAAALDIAHASKELGFLTVLFALQPEGTDFAVLDVEEGISQSASSACALYRLDASELQRKLESGESIAFLGYIPETVEILRV